MSAYNKRKVCANDVKKGRIGPSSTKKTKHSRLPLDGTTSAYEVSRFLPLALHPQSATPSPSEDLVPPVPPSDTAQSSRDTEGEVHAKSSQTTQTMEEFIEALPTLMHLLLATEADPSVLEQCSCGSNQPRTYHCRDCFKYQPSCEVCFLRRHQNLPFHWARIWRDGYYRKADISLLQDNTYAIHLCIHGSRCPSPSEPHKVTIVHTNGVHGTRLCYCHCNGHPKMLDQAMLSRLFPATVKSPKTFVTFQALDEFTEHNVTSKKSAYDYVAALRRLTDGCFTHKTPDPQSQFLVVVRIWEKLCLEKWSGQAHNLLAQFPHRTPGSIVRTCFCCPEEGFNMEDGWERTPAEYKHLNQDQRTIDGNFHIGQYVKNTDPNDVSLVTHNGIGYFPDQREVHNYLNSTPGNTEKSTCHYLNVVNNQNKKKFKNMRYSGVVNVACSHCIILSSVNLDAGEAFKQTDLALKHSFTHTRHGRLPTDLNQGACDFCLSYDCNCQYSVNLRERFHSNFPEYLPLIERIRCSIPALHIQDHKDDCKYKFNSAYMPNSGHFHGETAEQPWVEFNQLAGSVRQMNSGHRMGVLTFHYGFWNWTKITRQHMALASSYQEARRLFDEKRRAYLSSCVRYHHRIPEWTAVVAQKQRLPNEIIMDIYQHQLEVPSKQKIYEQLLASTSPQKEFSTNSSVYLIQLGIFIQHSQQRIKGKKTLNQTETVRKEISRERSTVATQISQFRELQASIMPGVQDLVIAIPSDVEPENEGLYLPSMLSKAERKGRNAEELGLLEGRVRTGELYECIIYVRNAAKYKSLAYKDKAENSRGTNASTRSALQIKRIEIELNSCIADYQRVRLALIQLGCFHIDELPIMTLDSTYRRPTTQARRVGDSHRYDGQLYTLPSALPESQVMKESNEDPSSDLPQALKTGTQQVRREPRSRPPSPQKQKKSVSKEDGWIWTPETMFALLGMQTENMTVFEDESDRILHYRTMAEMERWREVTEKTQSDFLRCIRAFQKMKEVWGKIADQNCASMSSNSAYHTGSFGHVAFARRQAKMYEELSGQCLEIYLQLSLDFVSEGEILADVVARQRARQAEEDRQIIEAEISAAQECDIR